MHNTGYPEAAPVLDQEVLRLRTFAPSAPSAAERLAGLPAMNGVTTHYHLDNSVLLIGADEPAVRRHLVRLHGVDTGSWERVARYDVVDGVPDQRPPGGATAGDQRALRDLRDRP